MKVDHRRIAGRRGWRRWCESAPARHHRNRYACTVPRAIPPCIALKTLVFALARYALCLAGIMGGEALLDVDADSIRFDLVSYVPLLHPILPIRPSLLLLYSLSFFLPSMVALAWDTAARRHV